MRKGENYNHPARGSQIRVEPIKKKKDIQSIKKLLSDNPRNQALFILGINTNLRASDLIGIKAGQVRDLKPGDSIQIKEKKTGKFRTITLNKACTGAIHRLLQTRPFKDDEPLFVGQRGPLTVPSVNRLVKSWCKDINLKGNYGSHTLRKTWGYHQRVSFGTDIPRLMICFNHSPRGRLSIIFVFNLMKLEMYMKMSCNLCWCY